MLLPSEKVSFRSTVAPARPPNNDSRKHNANTGRAIAALFDFLNALLCVAFTVVRFTRERLSNYAQFRKKNYLRIKA